MLFRKHLFDPAEKKQIVAAIAAAESQTTGQIRVHVEPRWSGDVLARAAAVFQKLKMHKTSKRNAVLIYLAYEDKKFAIVGDKGIHALVPANFWDNTKSDISAYFKRGQFLTGVLHGINESAQHLIKYFPRSEGHVNNMPNDISEG